jgi:hypothetical protein
MRIWRSSPATMRFLGIPNKRANTDLKSWDSPTVGAACATSIQQPMASFSPGTSPAKSSAKAAPAAPAPGGVVRMVRFTWLDLGMLSRSKKCCAFASKSVRKHILQFLG